MSSIATQTQRILVVDDKAIYREPIAALLRENGFDVRCASSGREALDELADRVPDLILLDAVMPELDGLGTLQAIRHNPRWKDIPVFFLTMVTDREHILSACGLGIQGYLLKDQFSVPEMLTRMRQQLNRRAEQKPASSIKPAENADTKSPPSNQPVAFGKPAVNDLEAIVAEGELVASIQAGLELKPLSPVVHAVMATTGSASASAEDVARAVSQDHVLTIRLLRLANGSVYSRGRPVSNIREAITRIGISEIRKLVLTLGAIEQCQNIAPSGLDVRHFWEHSIACGLIASKIAALQGVPQPEDYFLWGLVHDVGRMILLERIPEKYARVLHTAQELDLPVEVVERRMLRMDHCRVLEHALKHWGFPARFIVPVASHHQPPEQLRKLGGSEKQAALTIALANRLAHALLLGYSGNSTIYPLQPFLTELGLSRTSLEEIVDNAAHETGSAKTVLLAQSQDTDWPDWLSQLKAGIKIPVRALWVSCTEEPAIELILTRVGDIQCDSPGVAVLQLAHPRELDTAMKRLNERETELKLTPLPLLVLCSAEGIEPAAPGLRDRAYATLSTPTRVEQVLNAITALCTASASPMPAAS